MDSFIYGFQIFMLVWARMAAMIFIAPVFSAVEVPASFKGALAFLITLVIFPWTANLGWQLSPDILVYVLMIIKEAVFGLVLGFFVSLVFAAFALGTQFFSIQIGLAMAQVFDPMTQEETPVFSMFFQIVSMLVFLAIGGFHMLIRAVSDSYTLVPAVDFLKADTKFLEMSVKYFTGMFVIALKISFPVLAASLLVTLCLGLVGRIAPQANVMILGLPLQFFLGLLIVMLIVPSMIEGFSAMFQNAVNDIMLTLVAVKAQ